MEGPQKRRDRVFFASAEVADDQKIDAWDQGPWRRHAHLFRSTTMGDGATRNRVYRAHSHAMAPEIFCAAGNVPPWRAVARRCSFAESRQLSTRSANRDAEEHRSGGVRCPRIAVVQK